MSSSTFQAAVRPRLRARWMALGLLVATCATATVAAYAGRGWLEDSWWIWKLGSEDRFTRVDAAERLAERSCMRAVPRLVKAIADDPEERITTRTDLVVWAVYPDGPVQVGEAIEHAEGTPMVFALWQMGEPAVPSLKRCLDGAPLDTRSAGILERLLDRSKSLTRQGAVAPSVWARGPLPRSPSGICK